MKLLLSISLIAFLSTTNLFAKPALTRKCTQISAIGDLEFIKKRLNAEILHDSEKDDTLVSIRIQVPGTKEITASTYFVLDYISNGLYSGKVDDLAIKFDYDSKNEKLKYFKGQSITGFPSIDTLINYKCKK